MFEIVTQKVDLRTSRLPFQSIFFSKFSLVFFRLVHPYIIIHDLMSNESLYIYIKSFTRFVYIFRGKYLAAVDLIAVSRKKLKCQHRQQNREKNLQRA